MSAGLAEQDARHEICRIGRSLFERGYVHGTAGNISVRLDQAVLITPTDACLGHLQPERLAYVDASGQPQGCERPSKMLGLHRRIYAADPAARCVLHTHSTHLVALTLAGVWRAEAVLPPITPYSVMKVGAVPLVPYHRPGDPAVGTEVTQRMAAAQARGAALRAVLLERLGPLVWHASPAQAMAALEELEETARLWLMGGRSVTPLSAEQIDELQQAFQVRW